ncbi:hypothetical protein ACET3Z_032877 [Daucus carota]
MKFLRDVMLAAADGEQQPGQVLSVNVINSSSTQPESFELGTVVSPLFDHGTEQGEQVLEIQKCATNTHSFEEISTTAASKRTPEGVEQIISLDEIAY